MRKLATIQRITALRPIVGADLIEAADVLGWTVVVKKGDFKVGDLAVYFEIDSWLDASNPAFASFEERFTNWGTKRGMGLKTIKLRKQLSQGLLLKVDAFSELSSTAEGDDVTEILKVEKWEPIEEARSNAGGGLNKTPGAGKFPAFLRKTDQERVQNYINELPKHSHETFEVTVKLDGSSMTVYTVLPSSPHFAQTMEDIEIRSLRKKSRLQRLMYKVKKFFKLVKRPDYMQGVTSRNMEVGIHESNHFSTYAREHSLLPKILKLSQLEGRSLAFQGELIAPSIQGNYERVSNFEYYVYDVYDIDKQEYLLPTDARVATSYVGLKYVPILKLATLLGDYAGEEVTEDNDPANLRRMVDGILAYAEGPGMNPGVKREGVVFQSNESGFSFKAISNSYLLHKEKT